MEIDDREIVAAIRDNPEKGFSLLMKKYIEPVYWHIRRLVVSHADAQDAAQETFVRAFRSFGSFQADAVNDMKYPMFSGCLQTNMSITVILNP